MFARDPVSDAGSTLDVARLGTYVRLMPRKGGDVPKLKPEQPVEQRWARAGLNMDGPPPREIYRLRGATAPTYA